MVHRGTSPEGKTESSLDRGHSGQGEMGSAGLGWRKNQIAFWRRGHLSTDLEDELEKRTGEKNERKGGREKGEEGTGKGQVVQTRRSRTAEATSVRLKPRKRDRDSENQRGVRPS